jgi:hypothetical protein
MEYCRWTTGRRTLSVAKRELLETKQAYKAHCKTKNLSEEWKDLPSDTKRHWYYKRHWYLAALRTRWNRILAEHLKSEDDERPESACPACGSVFHFDGKSARVRVCADCEKQYIVKKSVLGFEREIFQLPYEVFSDGDDEGFRVAYIKPRKSCPGWMYDRAFVRRLVLGHVESRAQADRRALALWLYYRLGLEVPEAAAALGMPAEIFEKQIARLTKRAESMLAEPRAANFQELWQDWQRDKSSALVLVHSCKTVWRDELGRSVLTCRCKKIISRQRANRMVKTGEADWRLIPASKKTSKTPTRVSMMEIVLRAAVGKESRVPGGRQIENFMLTGKIPASVSAYQSASTA